MFEEEKQKNSAKCRLCYIQKAKTLLGFMTGCVKQAEIQVYPDSCWRGVHKEWDMSTWTHLLADV